MKTKNIIFYSLLFFMMFFTGFDNHVLWKRTFLENKEYELTQYLHYFSTILAAWGIGYFLFNKFTEKYPLKKTLPFSLILAAFSCWAQFRIGTQRIDDLVSGMIVQNMHFHLSVGVLIAAQKQILKELWLHHKKDVYISGSLSIATILLLTVFTEKNLYYYFLLTSIIYFVGFIFSLLYVPSSHEFKLEDRSTINFGFILGFFVILLSTISIEYFDLTSIKKFFDNSSIGMIFILCLFTGITYLKKIPKK